MHPALPIGFESWSEVLIDWAVSRALAQSGLPPCLAAEPTLAVAFVRDIGAEVRLRLLHRRTVEVDMMQQKATEPAYERAGGEDYRRLCGAMEQAQERFFAACSKHGVEVEHTGIADLDTCRAEKERLEQEFEAIRRRNDEHVHEVRRVTARAYWSVQPAGLIPDTFFADARPHATPSRLARVHPPWWGAFFGRLQVLLANGHPADGRLLDALPDLRAAARRKKLAAMIDEWRAANEDRWGWYGAIYYRMLTLRAGKKAVQLTRWIGARAPDYLVSETRRSALRAQLAERLTTADPWAGPMQLPWSSHFLSEHGSN